MFINYSVVGVMPQGMYLYEDDNIKGEKEFYLICKLLISDTYME